MLRFLFLIFVGLGLIKGEALRGGDCGKGSGRSGVTGRTCCGQGDAGCCQRECRCAKSDQGSETGEKGAWASENGSRLVALAWVHGVVNRWMEMGGESVVVREVLGVERSTIMPLERICIWQV